MNLLKFESNRLKVQNSQLLGLLFWVAPRQIIDLAHRQNLIHLVLREITSYDKRYQTKYENARVILGLNSLLLLPDRP